MSKDNSSVDNVFGYLKDITVFSVSGVVAKTVTAPIDRVKMILQTQDANPRILSGEVPKYRGIANCFKRIANEQGLRSFWRGNMVNILRSYPSLMLSYPFKAVIKKFFPKYDSKTHFGSFFLVEMTSGLIAGACIAYMLYPLDYARMRLAADVGTGRRDFNGLWDCLKKTTKGSKGFFSLFNGATLYIAGTLPYRFIYFGLYDSLRFMNPYVNESGLLGIVSKFAFAQTIAIATSLPLYPLETVVRRIQMQSEKPKEQHHYRGAYDCFKHIIKNEGFTGFFKGAATNAVRTVGSALVLVTYDQFKALPGA
eukprot:TRINITY_DN553_c0_g1_i1.p1 TRINITY_DN553_c0_g1~~TRINITY_DN553_c0_g1_i1.p1  ORF type:complete len:310 (+),score=48.18 TRINITY_DN553_c0_g1_i1:63-992(+)